MNERATEVATPRRVTIAPSTGDRLAIAAALRQAIVDAAREGYPLERCGLLVGYRRDRTARVVRVVPADNVATELPERRYELDPAAFLAADTTARDDGMEVVGFWHSHPDHPPVPSPTDLEAAWEGYSYLIAAVTESGVGELRSWRYDGRRFLEETISEEETTEP